VLEHVTVTRCQSRLLALDPAADLDAVRAAGELTHLFDTLVRIDDREL
jgi:hypothetical protein